MHEILKDLWYRNIDPQKKTLLQSNEYNDVFSLMLKNQETLNSMLNDKEKEVFEKFCDCSNEVNLYNEEDTFVAGFKLGARIITEALCD